MGIPVTSAGGILLQLEGEGTSILIVELEVEKRKNIDKKWAPVLRQLPKGGCKSGETLEQTALREVLEETGFEGAIISKAGEVGWSYERNGKIWDETVHYFFMKPLKFLPEKLDDEFDTTRWVNIHDAANILSYPEERQLIFNIAAKNDLPNFQG